jgi:predicted  nucleic acid-binding Zn-ribbon protein
MNNEDTVVAVARDMILPRDEIMLAARINIEAVNQSLALSIRATSSLVSIAKCLHDRILELNTQVPDLHHQIENLRNRLRDERRHRNNLERRNQELNARVDF